MVQVAAVLACVEDWAFDSFELDEVTGGRPLPTLAFALMKRTGLTASLRLDEARLCRCGRWDRTVSLQV